MLNSLKCNVNVSAPLSLSSTKDLFMQNDYSLFGKMKNSIICINIDVQLNLFLYLECV